MTRLCVLAAMTTALACGSDQEVASESASGSTSATETAESTAGEDTGPPADLPGADRCGDGQVVPGQLCYELVEVPLFGGPCEAIVAADVDGDDSDGIVLALGDTLLGTGPSTIHVLDWAGGLALERQPESHLDAGEAFRLSAGDVDLDGLEDVLVTYDFLAQQGDVGWQAIRPGLLFATLDGGFAFEMLPTNDELDTMQETAIAQVVAGGFLEVVQSGNSEVWSWSLADYQPAIVPGSSREFASNVTELATPDLDGDGTPDFVVATEDELVLTFTNDGTGELETLAVAWSDNLAFVIADLRVIDLDGDGLDDVLAIDEDAVTPLLSAGTGELSRSAGSAVRPIANARPGWAAEVADIDMDGTADLVAVHETDLSLWRGGPGATFATRAEPMLDGAFAQLAIGLVNDDPVPDIAVCAEDRALVLLSDP